MRTTTLSSKDEIVAVKEESQDSRRPDIFFERQGSHSKRRDSGNGQSIGFGGRDSGVDQSPTMVKDTIYSDEILAVNEENSCDG